jgi:F-type H+-transporting ATPase subunit a
VFVATDPLHQFQLKKLLPNLELGGFDISFTNSSLWMVIVAGVVLGLIWLAVRTPLLVPNRVQSIVEMIYEFVANTVRSTIGEDGMKFFPLIFTLFAFILTSNLLGMNPFGFTVTSHISVTFALAILVFAIVMWVGLTRQGFGFFKRFAPPGLPLPIYALIIPIEIISFIVRPFTLAVRLFANMLAGHTMLKVLAGFIPAGLGLSAGALFANGFPGILAGVGASIGVVAVTALEFLVAAIQAYVFTILTCIYLSEVVHEPHH